MANYANYNYSEEVFRKAEAELLRRKNTAEAEQKERKQRIYLEYPELAETCIELEKTGSEYFRIRVKGGPDMDTSIERLKERSSSLAEKKRSALKSLTGDEEYLNVKYSCPICEDSGYKDGRRCACFDALLKQYAADEIAENCGVKLNDFSDFVPMLYPAQEENGISPRDKMMKLFGYCRRYAEGFSLDSSSLLFIGKTGLGKTFLSSCIAKEVSKKGMSVAIGQLSTFLRRIEDEHFGRAEGRTLDTLAASDLLILDDLGSEFRTQFTESALYELINARLNSGRPTIISTNLSMSELNSTYNERLISRISGCFVPCMFFGKDVRPALRKI